MQCDISVTRRDRLCAAISKTRRGGFADSYRMALEKDSTDVELLAVLVPLQRIFCWSHITHANP